VKLPGTVSHCSIFGGFTEKSGNWNWLSRSTTVVDCTSRMARAEYSAAGCANRRERPRSTAGAPATASPSAPST
jgi:hypothetical protein